MYRIIFLLLVLIAVGYVVYRFNPFQAQVNLIPKSGNLIFFGDSLTAGVGADSGEDFPSLIAAETNVPTINAGVPGNTTKDALNRIETDVIKNKPKIVVVYLGGNDFLQKTPIEETIRNMDEIVRKINQETKAKIVLINTKVGLNDPFAKPFKQIAKKYGATYVDDMLADILTTPGLTADPIHPNSKGYKIMADRILKVLKPLL